MKPSRFDYHAPKDLAEALDLMGELGEDATPLAGGQSLVPMMNLRMAQPFALVDLNDVPDLAYVRREDDALAIGAMTRHRVAEHSPEVARDAPLIAVAERHVAYPVIRARGTVGGSVAHADPSAELSCVLIATDASVVLASTSGRRELRAEEYFAGPYMTHREPEELLVELRVPLAPPDTRFAFGEMARKAGDFALVLVAVALTMQDERCVRARVAVGGAGSVPVRAHAAEQALDGRQPTTALIADAARAAAQEVDVNGDAHGSAAYRRRLVEVEVRRALERAATNAQEDVS
ncbi:MAG TPA: xanthine dehydrogenase family protein subunit M [Conexibacter sp.]|nr:xanthine dehydrogenase family protein subunit M [Conexibacter sp.]